MHNRLENHFAPFRRQIIGYDQTFATPYGEHRIVYGDWTASGRLYAPIEEAIAGRFGPFVGNTHSESSVTGTSMTRAYHLAHERIKRHVNAGPEDVIITTGSGMTAAVNKWQRMLGLRVPEQLADYLFLPDESRPVVFLTHMEHHSNQTSWLETIADVEVIEPDPQGRVNLDHLYRLLRIYRDRQMKIGTFTACSNVTGICTPYHALARIMHEHGGLCFIDFAASAPYVPIDMHPADPLEKLDAIYFSPHKFLGGPGSSGVLIFASQLYTLRVPDQPGGGTVNWTNPWGEHRFVDNIEAREDGGTPGFLQAIRAALSIELKELMGVSEMLEREEGMKKRIFAGLRALPDLHILADHIEERLGIFSFYSDKIHYNLFVKLLNDRFGIQVRGGCSCAGTYGHYLLHVDPGRSHHITERIDHGDLSDKPGWVRLSIHPTMTDAEIDFIIAAIGETVRNAGDWEKEYRYSPATNEFLCLRETSVHTPDVTAWFDLNT
jgi:selenocysteine lyase/cysteine desulfurase